MEKYKINFKLLEESNINGLDFKNKPNIEKFCVINNKYKYPPIKYIDESIQNHIVQIIFLIKEYFTDIEKGFIGWNDFTKKDLVKLFVDNKEIYINEFENGKEFVKEFPNKIIYFLNYFCYKKIKAN